MTLFEMTIIAIAVSLDGFWGGLAYGLKNARIGGRRLIWIGLMSTPITLIALIAAMTLRQFIPETAAQYISAAALILIGVMSFLQSRAAKDIDAKASVICVRHGLILGFAVAVDASVATFAAGLLGAGFILPFIMGIAHVFMIGFGNWLGRSGVRRITFRLKYLPACILILLGITQVI